MHPSRIADNVVHFARVLRAAGLPIGPDRVVDAVKAVEVAGLSRRDDFYWTLAAVLIAKREHFELFDQAFKIFWRDPQLLARAMSLMLPPGDVGQTPRSEVAAPNRLAEALLPLLRQSPAAQPEEEEQPRDAAMSFSRREVLQHADFESMTQAELAEA